MAEQLEAYTTGGTTEYIVRKANAELGQTFKHHLPFDITSIKLKLWKQGTPGENLVVSIYATAGGEHLPSGEPIATVNYPTSNIALDTPGTAGTWYTVSISAVGLSANTYYAIVLGPDEADWGWGKWIKWRQDHVAPLYANGFAVVEVNDVWNSYNYDFMFEVWGTAESPLPGPPTIVSPTPTGVTGITLDETPLEWAAGDPAGDTYEIYFRESGDAWELVGVAQAGITWVIVFGTLAYGTTYQWRIDATNEYGTTTGATWSFDTIDYDQIRISYRLISGGSGAGPYDDPPGTQGTDWEYTGLNNMISVKRLVVAANSKIFYESI